MVRPWIASMIIDAGNEPAQIYSAIICSSVCLLLDILPHLPEYENRIRFCAENRD
jgi:hypothetical protein